MFVANTLSFVVKLEQINGVVNKEQLVEKLMDLAKLLKNAKIKKQFAIMTKKLAVVTEEHALAAKLHQNTVAKQAQTNGVAKRQNNVEQVTENAMEERISVKTK